jgi:hypothetical protein
MAQMICQNQPDGNAKNAVARWFSAMSPASGETAKRHKERKIGPFPIIYDF